MARRALLLVLAAATLGLLLGYPFELVSLALGGLLVVWIYQLSRIDHWLKNTEVDPPEAYGIWGGIFDQIYKLQRENKESRSRLQSTVAYLQDSFTSMRDSVVMVDKDGIIQWSNTAAEKVLGLRYPADRGQALLNLMRAPEFTRYFLSGDYSEALKFYLIGDEGLHLQVEITRFGEGDRLIFIRDVTEVTRLEQTRSDFVANVSHELRTPLTVITGYLESMLPDGDLSPRYGKAMLQMSQQAARMENLLKDLLWLSRIENVEDEVKEDRVDVRGLLEGLRDELSVSHGDNTIELQLESEQKILGDYQELHSAVSNLVLNAIKYSTQSDVIRISWKREGPRYVLAVRDHGIGIDSAHLPRLTERFYRVDESRSLATGGTGLGLAIVKHVAAAHKAELRIESVLGVGSNFSLIFPGDDSTG